MFVSSKDNRHLGAAAASHSMSVHEMKSMLLN